MSYLNELHPEIFEIIPRAGGLAKIKPARMRVASKTSSTKQISGKGSKISSKRGSKVTIKTTTTAGTFDSKFFRPTAAATPKRTTREYRIKKILSSSPWLLFDDDDDTDNVLPPDPIHDAMLILSAAISTIMLMAAGYQNIPRQHLIWTLSYLECVKDDHGNTPPNIRGIMNNIKLIDNTLISFLEADEDDDLVGGLVFAAPAADTTAPVADTATTAANTTPVEPQPTADEAV